MRLRILPSYEYFYVLNNDFEMLCLILVRFYDIYFAGCVIGFCWLWLTDGCLSLHQLWPVVRRSTCPSGTTATTTIDNQPWADHCVLLLLQQFPLQQLLCGFIMWRTT